MITIGLTGGIATGKSTVSQILKKLGAILISADEIAHRVIQPGEPAYEMVIDSFGREIVNSEGIIDRSKLGSRVFNDPQARHTLEQIIHPVVIAEINKEISRLRNEDTVVVVEVPLLFETGMEKMFDYIWVVSAKVEEQYKRLLERNRFTREEATQRIESQMALLDKEARADAVIYNNQGLAELEDQVERMFFSFNLSEAR